ncbi:hypothetical protein O6P43_031202 [Quillaja saponaria]|uniref:Uncharacterized protein n=1 Tax=Quillaja saponaria TaxID=32244 RepID=A0AAD7P8R1_QUISA|nr:hypothetical protein O6P43_031202 [Quillaja saponaria]
MAPKPLKDKHLRATAFSDSFSTVAFWKWSFVYHFQIFRPPHNIFLTFFDVLSKSVIRLRQVPFSCINCRLQSRRFSDFAIGYGLDDV